MDECLITIGITTFNAEESIKRTLQSALDQNWPNTEIIIIDDCSSDQTVTLIIEFSKIHSTIKLFQNNVNKGVAYTRNSIIEEASGEFICFFDDDDYSVAHRLSSQYSRIVIYEKLVGQNTLIICHSARHVTYPDQTIRIEKTIGENDGEAPHGIGVAKRIITGSPLKNCYGACPTCSQMSRKSTYLSVGGFDEQFRRSEDTDLNVRLAKAGAHFVGISSPLVHQTMTKTTDKSLTDERYFMLQLLKKHKDITTSDSHYAFCKQWLQNKYDFLEGKKFSFVVNTIKLISRHPILSLNRLLYSLKNVQLNRDYSKFHGQ